MKTSTRKTLLKASFILVSLYGLGWAIEKVLDFGIRHNYDFKPAMAASGNNPFDVLVIGPSRGGLHDGSQHCRKENQFKLL
ncbi:hypothetical protein [Siphonobacter sp. SORGH_AS_0500]|uniref:hypothetical protein n=1 Tax=Siphonobacter sp. SORGH_AS_0500 TaxID=1864824 RepID=UPI00285F6FD5|nr:hypothetical protein [Siphonobacter sp. SORGH_AS_0500]MDR6194786.1 hypothetical protein [Siphonobacter sp. SORGH_AS_0500]